MADDVSLSVGLTGDNEVVAAVERLRKDAREIAVEFAKFFRQSADAAKEFDKELKNTNQTMERTATSAVAIGTVIGQSIVGAFRAAKDFIVGAVRSNLEWADSIKDMSEATGASIKTIQELTTAAKLEGESVAKVEQAFTQLTQKVIAAREGSKSAQEAFAKLQLDPTKFKSSQEAIDQTFAAIQKLPDGMEKSQVAAELFGRRLGAAMVQIIGSTEEARKALRDFGLELTGDQIAALDSFKKTLNLAQLAMEALGRQITVELAPAFEFLVRSFLDSKREGEGVVGVAQNIGEAFRWLGGWVIRIQGAFVGLGRTLGATMGFFSELPGAIKRGFSAGGISGAIDAVRGLQDAARDMRDEINLEMGDAFEKAGRLMSNDFPKATAAAGAAASGFTGTIKEKTKAVKDLLAPLRQMKERLEEQVATFGMSESAAAEWKVTHGELGKIAGANAEAYRREIVALTQLHEVMKFNKEQAEAVREAEKKANEEKERSIEANNKFRASQFDAAAAMERSVDPVANYFFEIEKVQKLHTEYGLSLDATRKKMLQLTKEFEKARDAGDPMKEMFDELIRAVEGFGKKFTENVTDFLVEGKLEIGNFAKEVHRLITNMLINTFVTKPIQDFVTDMIKELQRGEGFVSQIFGGNKANSGFGESLVGKLFGGMTGGGGGGGAYAGVDFGSFAGAYAGGGVIPAGFSGIVGEAGPELITPTSRSRITPGEDLGGSVSVTNNFYVSGPLDQRSQSQAAARAGDSVRQAMRKNR